MKLIVGLGNPGEKYFNNRHNVGFQFIDYLIENLKISNDKFQMTNKFQITNFKFQKNQSSNILHLTSNIILAKPMTFMNLSGKSVTELFKKFKIKIEELIVVHDDLDIPIGKFKIQKGVGPQLHNGLESIEKELGTKDFWRVRIGIDNRPAHRSLGEGGIDGETYVLHNFTSYEKKTMLETFPKILNRLKTESLLQLVD